MQDILNIDEVENELSEKILKCRHFHFTELIWKITSSLVKMLFPDCE
jgi:hypothetical protein